MGRESGLSELAMGQWWAKGAWGGMESIWIAISTYTGGWNGIAGVYGMYLATER
jgi:hypothetical protein